MGCFSGKPKDEWLAAVDRADTGLTYWYNPATKAVTAVGAPKPSKAAARYGGPGSAHREPSEDNDSVWESDDFVSSTGESNHPAPLWFPNVPARSESVLCKYVRIMQDQALAANSPWLFGFKQRPERQKELLSASSGVMGLVGMFTLLRVVKLDLGLWDIQ